MYINNLVAIIKNKNNKEDTVVLEVMELNYKVKDSILYIIDHRNHIFDFDLNDVDVEIVTKNLKDEKKVCVWEYDDFEEKWQTDCGVLFELPDSNQEITHFCPFCGNEITVKTNYEIKEV